ncbi:MAG: SpoIIE family protein phosphatase [Planctomycetota bacterium]
MGLKSNTRLKLTDFVDVETLQALQDGFASTTGIATSIRTPDGEPITRNAEQSAFCTLVKSTPSGQAACRLCHANAAKLVQETDAPRRSECHAGLAQFSAPIIVDGKHLGAIIVGDRPLTSPTQADVESLAREYGLSVEDLTRATADLLPWSDDAMSAAAGFIQQLANTIAKLCYQTHQLRQRVDELAALHEVGLLLARETELQGILDASVRKLVDALGLRAAAIRLLDEDMEELRIAAVAHMSTEYMDTTAAPLRRCPIDGEALTTGRTVFVEDVRTDPRTYFKESLRKEGLVSALVVPLSSDGHRIGVLRAYMGRRYRFTSSDVSLLEAIASQVAAAIANARLRDGAREARKLDRQVKMASEVQRRMIPASPPVHSCYQFGCVYEPNSQLGGDFYDFVGLPGGDIGIVIADVVGKGVPASLMMASTRSALRSHAKRVSDIGELMQLVNLRVCHDTLPAEFVTACYVMLSRDGRRLTYCNAGHEPLLLLRRGRIETLDVGGLVLGLAEDATYQWAEAELEAGDLLVLLTDGLIEAINYGDEAYGRERLHSSIKLHGAMAADMPVDLIAKQLLWDVRRFVGLAPQTDDMTLVVTRVSNGSPERR